MIVGIGLDLVEIRRVEQALDRFGDRFGLRVLRPSEWEYCLRHKTPALPLAGRFAAKEAASKALGTGIGTRLTWTDLEVVHNPLGKPQLVFHGKGLDCLRALGARVGHLSLTHTETTAAAVVILES